MVDDPPFAAFLDALLAALEAVGAIVAGSQTSFDDMVGAWAGAAPKVGEFRTHRQRRLYADGAHGGRLLISYAAKE